MQAFELEDLRREDGRRKQAYYEFLRVPSLSCGLYHLRAGRTDPQTPHAEDEIYYVLGGRATVRVGTEDRPVHEGTVVFVGRGMAHRFHRIEEDLSVLVVFAPAEGSASPL